MTALGIGSLIAGIGGSVFSGIGSRKASKRAERRAAPREALQLEQAQLRFRIAQRFEELANKLLNDEPISPQERNAINAAEQVATQGISQARQQAVSTALGEQAATGFLRSGRTASQLRRLNVQAGEAQQRVQAQREQAVANAIRQNRQQALQALGGAAGVPLPQFQQFEQGLPTESLIGTGLSSLGGAGLQFAAGQQQANLLKSLIGGGGQAATGIPGPGAGSISGAPANPFQLFNSPF